MIIKGGTVMKKIYLMGIPFILSLSLAGCNTASNIVVASSTNAEGDSEDVAQESPKTTEKTEHVIEEANQTEANSEVKENIIYENQEYGFTFSLPKSWSGYKIVTDTWEGRDINQQDKITANGPILSIRHPQWTEENPRQDIPIMVFTHEQWISLQEEEFVIGAAPILPSILGENDDYVFALPARYNFAFPEGYEEVEDILETNPLQTK